MKSNRRTAVVADDEAQVRALVRSMLENQGFTRIFQATNGVEALELIERESPELVICDWTMPQMSGIEVLERIRRSDRLGLLPFVMLTGATDAAHVERAAKTQVDAYIVKPFTEQIFRDRVSQALAKRGKLPGNESLQLVAEKYAKAGNLEMATKSYESMLDGDPLSAPARIGLAEIALGKGEFDKSRDLILRAMEDHPDFVGAYDLMGRLFHRLGDIDGRLKAMEKAIELGSANAFRQAEYAESLLHAGRNQEAMASDRRAFDLDPEFGAQAKRIAEEFLLRGQFGEAAEMFEKALELNPDSLEIYNRTGIAYRRQGRFEEAIGLYNRALRVSPRNAKVIYNKACVYLEWRHVAEARRQFKEALSCDPNLAEARHALDLL